MKFIGRLFLHSALVRLFYYNDVRAFLTTSRFIIEEAFVCFWVAIGTAYIVNRLLMLLPPR